jgi:hypothetical protein
LQYILALTIETAAAGNDLHLDYLAAFAWGKQTMKEEELALEKEQEELASTL